MKKFNLVISLLAFVAVLGFYYTALGIEFEDDPNITDCEEWTNCNPNPPNFDGTCCRICFIKDRGYREWVCALHTNDVGFTEEEIDMLKQRFLYNGENEDVRKMLIMELNVGD